MASPVVISQDANGRTSAVVLSHGGARVKVAVQGAHVEQWTTASGASPIYMSPAAVYADGKALRGGVPICFPQFNDMGPLAQSHGFARNTRWEIGVAEAGADSSHVSFVFKPVDDSQVAGVAGLSATFTVRLWAEKLQMELQVRNDGPDERKFTTALHTYFAVADIGKLRISGVLDSCRYADSLHGRKMFDAAPINRIAQEVDRVYTGTDVGPVVLHDGTGPALEITQSGFKDVVLWNPWIEKAKKLADLPDDGYTKFVCVEAAAALTPFVVPAGGFVAGSQTIVAGGSAGSSNL